MGIFTFPAVLKRRASGILVPSGLIIPYNGTTAPTGWTLFTSADGKFIIGAGNTYAVAATGGNTSITTSDSDTQGAHTGTNMYTGGSLTGSSRGLNSAGGHQHALTYNYTPPYYGLRLIKADSELDQLPAKAVMFAGKSLSGLTRFSSGDGKLFSARSSIGAGGSNTIGATASSSAGSHDHGDLKDYGATNLDGFRVVSAGAHSHNNSSFFITPNLYRALLSAWTNASSAFNLKAGMYAFYENTTPPDGWYLCNGSNGTLDLRNYFIEFTDETDDGTRSGDGTLTVPDINLATYGTAHDHKGNANDDRYTSYHTTYTWTHSHTIVGTSPTFLPQYYALAIIQLAA